MNYRLIEPKAPVPESFKESILIFRERAEELRNNYSDITGGASDVSFGFERKENGTIRLTDGPDFNRHRLKGLYVDYRAVTLESDPCSFSYINSQLGRYYDNPTWREISRRLKEAWRDAAPLGAWGKYSHDEICNVAFYYRMFHSNSALKQAYNEMLHMYGNEALSANIFLGIHYRLRSINNLDFIVSSVGLDGSPLKVPNVTNK